MAWGMVVGGSMYLSQMRLPSVRIVALEGFAGAGDLVGVAGLVGVLETLPVFVGELGVDGEEGMAARRRRRGT